MSLTLPDVRQRSDHDCGVACAVAVCRYYGTRPGYDTAVAGLRPTPIDGTDVRTLESWFRAHGFRVLAGEMDLDDLRRQLAKGRPVLCAVDGHWVVATGVGRVNVAYHDPEAGPCQIRRSEFLTWWKDSDRLGSPYRQFGLSIW